MSAVIPNFFSVPDEIRSAKEYVERMMSAQGRVPALLSFYAQDTELFNVTLPQVVELEAKLQSFAKASWLNSSIKANGVRLIVDSVIPLKNDDDSDYNQDLILVFFSNKLGCFVNPQPYVFNRDDRKVEWVDRRIEDNLIMDAQPDVINMLAAQFFFGRDEVPWVEYVEYLEHEGFAFRYCSGFDKRMIEYAQATLY